MPTKNTSARPSRKSKPSSPNLSPKGKRLLASLHELKAGLEGSPEGRGKLHVYHYDVPDRIDVRAIREKIGMSQAQFSARFAISPRTLQDWEQGRRVPDATVRAYLTVIARDAAAVEKALSGR